LATVQTIGELLRSHPGAEAWIFGKGPSLDSFDVTQAGPLRICINESLTVVPSPMYFFAHDEVPIRRVADRWPDGCRAILQSERAVYGSSCGIPVGSIWTYAKSERDVEVLDWSAEQIAQRFIPHCTFAGLSVPMPLCLSAWTARAATPAPLGCRRRQGADSMIAFGKTRSGLRSGFP
jgi:hypothetical protein